MEEEHVTKVDVKMKTCFAAGCWGMRVILWESSHVQVAKAKAGVFRLGGS